MNKDKEGYKNGKMKKLAVVAKRLKETQTEYEEPYTEEHIKEQHQKRVDLIKSEHLRVVFDIAPKNVTKEKFLKQEKERFNNKLDELKRSDKKVDN